MIDSVTIPNLITDRLVLRAPRVTDQPVYAAFKSSARSRFTGGPLDAATARRNFAAVAGEWVMRGYGLFTGALKSDPDTAIGGFGIFHPLGQKEPEFGWSLWDERYEGQGYVTEAMRATIPWAWSVIGVDTAQSHIDEGNAGSVAVARALGATFDPETTRIENAQGGEHFNTAGRICNIWRHRKGALV
jgi:RimJ/RimL family protein N-acetyltransferase